MLLGDDLIDPSVPLLRDMLASHERTGASVLAAMHVGAREIAMYGCIGPGDADGDLVRVLSIVEKPDPADAPSDLAVIGRYVLTPAIFDALRRTTPGAGGEIQLTDAIGLLAADEPVFALPFAARAVRRRQPPRRDEGPGRARQHARRHRSGVPRVAHELLG